MKKDFLAEFKNAGIMYSDEMTQDEFREALLRIQAVICKLVFEDNEYHRIDEAIATLERAARSRKIEYDPEFRKGMNGLRRINKEIAISMSGKHGEKRVAKALAYITRPNYKYSNVYITDGETETELDNVILTESGIIILEVKNVKNDITISETGRLLYSNQECFHDVSICEKMESKRNLLKAELEDSLREKDLDIPVHIDSYLVFSAPKGVYINVTDLSHKEKFCFRGRLPLIIDGYTSKEVYSESELKELSSILGDIETRKKKFALNFDICELLHSIAFSMDMCLNEAEEISTKEKQIEKKEPEMIMKTSQERIITIQDYKKKRPSVDINVFGHAVATAAVIVFGLLATGLSLKRA